MRTNDLKGPHYNNQLRFTTRYPCFGLPVEELRYVRRPGMYLCPVRSSIHESVAESWPVFSREEAKCFLPELLREYGIRPFEPSELTFKKCGYDSRIDSEVEYILTSRYFNDNYETPQVCGYFEIQYFRPDVHERKKPLPEGNE